MLAASARPKSLHKCITCEPPNSVAATAAGVPPCVLPRRSRLSRMLTWKSPWSCGGKHTWADHAPQAGPAGVVRSSRTLPNFWICCCPGPEWFKSHKKSACASSEFKMSAKQRSSDPSPPMRCQKRCVAPVIGKRSTTRTSTTMVLSPGTLPTELWDETLSSSNDSVSKSRLLLVLRMKPLASSATGRLTCVLPSESSRTPTRWCNDPQMLM
mmetsp:Transcript_2728/g.7831  ORF Transcript_2728/g.7831 Transcript_2728/m.7831 type:complete len:212 (+) Transcript_2728:113-748(+)